jgi:hypothetical protein
LTCTDTGQSVEGAVTPKPDNDVNCTKDASCNRQIRISDQAGIDKSHINQHQTDTDTQNLIKPGKITYEYHSSYPKKALLCLSRATRKEKLLLNKVREAPNQ